MEKLKLKLIYKIFSCLIFIHILPFSSYAILDSQIDIISNDLILNNKSSTVKFFGDVVLYFDKIILKTSCIKVFYDKNKNIKKIIIPNKFSALDLSSNNIITAENAVYEMEQNKLIISNNVYILYIKGNNNNIISTHELIYYTKINKIKK